MPYIINVDLTDSYIEELITRNNFQNVTASHQDWGAPYVIQDLNGNLTGWSDLGQLRDWLCTQFAIIQNS